MEFSYTKSTDTSTNMVTKDYSKSRMRENRTYGSVRGGQSNLIPSTRLTALRAEGCGLPLRAMLIKSALRDDLAVPYGMISILQWKTIQPRLRREVGLFSHERSPVVRFYHKRAPSII